MNAVIFGSSGQDGYYLRQLLSSQGLQVTGVSRSGGDVQMSVANTKGVSELFQQLQPAYIFHLASVSSTSHQYLWENHESIATGTLALLEAVEHNCKDARVLVVGSGLQFRRCNNAIGEDEPLDHSSPYVLSRNYSLFATRYYRDRGLKTFFAYLFNHDSPRRGSNHLNMKVAEHAVRAAHGDSAKLGIGDLAAVKEFAYAGDITEALWALINQDKVTECVVGSGVGHSVQEWVECCYGYVGLDWRDHIFKDSNYVTPYTRLVSSPKTIMSLGWRPKVDISELCRLMMVEAEARYNKASALSQADA